jgi:ABC-type transport system involved in multi-copper enzyme maturation permease subunit
MWRYQDALLTISGEPFPVLSRYVMLASIGGEACFYAARMFHEELKWGTLPSLMTLPQPLAALAYAKLGGCLLGLIPAVMVFLVLVAVVPPMGSQSAPLAGSAAWMLLMQFVVLLHLTVLFSLFVNWGALALAVGTLLILNALLSLPFSFLLAGVAASYNDEHATIGPIIYFGCAASAVLQVLIALRLRTGAAR